MLLKNWFEDHELYHKIGYLIASKEKKLKDIYKESIAKTKSEFNEWLDYLIRERIKLRKVLSIDIFNSTIKAGDQFVKLDKIVIPMIQRDYAQGRANGEIKRIRDDFPEALYKAVADDNLITSDFVYGDIQKDDNNRNVMTPLDGQQRLTTLFLLHWYAAKHGGINDKDCGFLK